MFRSKHESTDEHISVLRRRWRKFRTIKRGWYSFLALLALYAASFLNPFLINNRALIVKYGGEFYFPVLAKHYEASSFGQRRIGEADYRELAKTFSGEDGDNWILMPPYPYHPNESLLTEAHLVGPPPHAPSDHHWLGTDDRDRDVFARLAYGFNTSITFGLCVVAFSYVVGMILGACFGYFGGRVDMYGQRLVEIWAGMPFLYTVIIIASIVKPNVFTLICILGVFRWMSISFYMRGEFYREKAKDYTAAAISQGESNASIMFRHILPNSLTPIISFAPFALVASIVALVSLDYLGFGVRPPAPSWGELVGQGLDNITEWHLVLFPLGALFATLMMVVFIGEAVREAFDPKVYSRLR
ncbi:MAG: peptide ABC transporter permease [Planctomycetes bacterium]|nr:peptide ABC transporter permease [Planctomycetota bacterium]MDP6408150.1 ABC transporter permease subunit [Planctomycetota bacterium]